MSREQERPITLVTGTRKGIGEYLAKHYMALGHIVIGCSRSTPDWAAEDGQEYRHFTADVADEKAVRQMFNAVRREFGRLDNLINNAGIASMNHIALTPMDTVDKILATNTKGTYLMSREAYKLMQRGNFGRIVNFATVATPLKLEGEAIYAASKAAIVTLTQIMAKEFADANITVNAVGPTPVKTDLIRNVPLEKMQRLLDAQSIHRYGEFRDIANVVDFFLRLESDFVTGQVVYLGGL